MINSESYSERLWSWLGWRTNVGDAIRPHFETYIEMKNKWAQLNGFDDYGQYWRSDYEMENDNFNDLGILILRQFKMQNIVLALEEFEKIKPLYQELHAYVRHRLAETFGDVIDTDGGLLPANILGDMWGRFWTGLFKFVIPYPDAPSVDVTDELVAQGQGFQDIDYPVHGRPSVQNFSSIPNKAMMQQNCLNFRMISLILLV